MINYFQVTTENVTSINTEELAKMYWPARDGKTFSFQCLNNAIRLDVIDRKLANAKKNYEQSKETYKLIANELVSRGVKTVYRNGQYN